MSYFRALQITIHEITRTNTKDLVTFRVISWIVFPSLMATKLDRKHDSTSPWHPVDFLCKAVMTQAFPLTSLQCAAADLQSADQIEGCP